MYYITQRICEYHKQDTMSKAEDVSVKSLKILNLKRFFYNFCKTLSEETLEQLNFKMFSVIAITDVK